VASSEDRGLFARFLELPDPEIAAYLLGDVVAQDAEFAGLARRIVAAHL